MTESYCDGAAQFKSRHSGVRRLPPLCFFSFALPFFCRSAARPGNAPTGFFLYSEGKAKKKRKKAAVTAALQRAGLA
jgi:hypothetical protein